jgi:hypothetical protein
MRRINIATMMGALLLGLLAQGCVTPVIPLPPPLTDSLELASCDTTNKTISFKAEPKFTAPGNYVFLFNNNLAKGIITQADGNGGFAEIKSFPAEDGHQILVWVKAAVHEENKSDTITVTVDCSKKTGKGNGFNQGL